MLEKIKLALLIKNRAPDTVALLVVRLRPLIIVLVKIKVVQLTETEPFRVLLVAIRLLIVIAFNNAVTVCTLIEVLTIVSPVKSKEAFALLVITSDAYFNVPLDAVIAHANPAQLIEAVQEAVPSVMTTIELSVNVTEFEEEERVI